MSKMDYRQIISDFNRDLNVIPLVEKYEMPSLWDAMGVGRQEMSHSSFIGEIFKENSVHDLGILPLQWFLDLFLDNANEQDKKKADDDENDWSGKFVAIPAEIQQAILTHTLNPSNIKVETEKTIPEGRVDLVVDFDIEAVKINDRQSTKHFTIVVENRINSKEHADQTPAYCKYFESLKRDKGRFVLYVYLTPEPPKNLRNAYILPFCHQKNFIQINYQNILGHIISPALSHTERNTRHFLWLSEYKRALEVSFNNMETKGKEVKCTVMAVDKDSADELYRFWEKYGALLPAAENAKCGNYKIEVTEKRQQYLWNGDVYDGAHLMNAIMCSYAENHTHDEVVETFGKEDGNDVTDASFSAFRDHGENIGYSIENYEADTINREEYDLLLAFYNKHYKLIAATKALLEFSDLERKEARPLPF